MRGGREREREESEGVLQKNATEKPCQSLSTTREQLRN